MLQVGTIRGPGAFGLLGIGQDVLPRQGVQGGYGAQHLLLLHRIMAGEGNLRLELGGQFPGFGQRQDAGIAQFLLLQRAVGITITQVVGLAAGPDLHQKTLQVGVISHSHKVITTW